MTTRGKYLVGLVLNVAVLLLAVPFGGPATIPALAVCGVFAIVSMVGLVRPVAG